MTGTAHRRRGGNDTGYIRMVMTDSGARYHARLRNKWLGSYETRAEAQRAINNAKVQLGIARSEGNDAA